jgi:hypothetical protein
MRRIFSLLFVFAFGGCVSDACAQGRYRLTVDVM